jgi:hypothetical protein
MRVFKRRLAKLDKVYAVAKMEIDKKLYLLAATEDEGSCLLFSPPQWQASVVWSDPGGAMNIIPTPRKEGAFYAIQKFFPVFKSEKACVVFAQSNEAIEEKWKITNLIDIPFVHRIEIAEVAGSQYLIASTLCGGKDFQDDWSKPGNVYAAKIPDKENEQWNIETIYEGITKNHGLYKCILDDDFVILTSGSEGLIKITIPQSESGLWRSECLINHEISDVAISDLDNDGYPEIITIEPFHGNQLVVYKKNQNRWERIAEKEINFGHVVWAGRIMGTNSIIVGSRGGRKELEILQLVNENNRFNKKNAFKSITIDDGVGAAQITVFTQNNRDYILSANHGANEVALYELGI